MWYAVKTYTVGTRKPPQIISVNTPLSAEHPLPTLVGFLSKDLIGLLIVLIGLTFCWVLTALAYRYRRKKVYSVNAVHKA